MDKRTKKILDKKNKVESNKERVVKENLNCGVFISGNSVDTWKCPLCDRKYNFEDEMKECIDSHQEDIKNEFKERCEDE